MLNKSLKTLLNCFFGVYPIAGYSSQKRGIRLMFWSGMGFNEDKLQPPASGKFKDASIFYTNASEVDTKELTRWLRKSRESNGITKTLSNAKENSRG